MPSLQGSPHPTFAYSPSYNPFLSVNDKAHDWAPHDDVSAFDSVYDPVCYEPPYTASSVPSTSSAVDYLSSDFYGPDESLAYTATDTPTGSNFSPPSTSSQPISIPQASAQTSFLADLLDMSLSITAPEPSFLQDSWPDPSPLSTSLPSRHLVPYRAPSSPLSSQSSISSPTTHNTSLSESESVHKRPSGDGVLRIGDINTAGHVSPTGHNDLTSDVSQGGSTSAVALEQKSHVFGQYHSTESQSDPVQSTPTTSNEPLDIEPQPEFGNEHDDVLHDDASQDDASHDETFFPDDTPETPEFMSLPLPPVPGSSLASPQESVSPSSGSPPDYMSLPLMFDSVVANKAPVPVPRPEEGHEALPPYSCSVHLEGYFPKKQEFCGKIISSDRSWRSKYILIVGTVMKIYKHDLASHPIADHHDWSADKASDMCGSDPSSQSRFFIEGQVANPESPYSAASFSSSSINPPRISTRFNNFKDNVRAKTHMPPSNQLVSELSLQHAECGLATDYLKHPFVVRVRTAKEQFLVQCPDAHSAVTFIETVQAAANIALDLDERPMPKASSSRRRRRRRNRRVVVNGSRSNPGGSSRDVYPRDPFSQSRSLAHEEARKNRDILRDVAALRLAI